MFWLLLFLVGFLTISHLLFWSILELMHLRILKNSCLLCVNVRSFCWNLPSMQLCIPAPCIIFDPQNSCPLPLSHILHQRFLCILSTVHFTYEHRQDFTACWVFSLVCIRQTQKHNNICCLVFIALQSKKYQFFLKFSTGYYYICGQFWKLVTRALGKLHWIQNSYIESYSPPI